MPDLHEIRHRELAQKDWVSQEIVHAQRKRFYGKLTFIIEKGVIRRMIKEESKEPPM